MIFYFSGLGNTKYVAEKISEILEEDLHFIPDTDPSVLGIKGKDIGLIFPIYSWGIPANVLAFINAIPFSFWEDVKKADIPVWMVCSYGDETGDTPNLLRNILSKRGVELKGAWGVRMPNTYVILPGFDVDSVEVENKKLSESVKRIEWIGQRIRKKIWEEDCHKGSFPYLRTKLIYPIFLKKGINPKKWHYTSACVKCGKCVSKCSIHNITMGEYGPLWGKDCISCLACYHFCPYHAVEYGTITRKKGQYHFPGI